MRLAETQRPGAFGSLAGPGEKSAVGTASSPQAGDKSGRDASAGRFHIRPMQLDDVDRIGEIELLCFPLPWPKETYRRDLSGGGVSHYMVCERLGRDSGASGAGVEALFVVGFGGYWLIQDECHISTIGVHPGFRGMGLGEFLLASMVGEGMEAGAQSSTLEVRVSNASAQRLYSKYDYRVIGRRRRYYRDNNEDALVMSIESLVSGEYRARFRRLWQALMLRLNAKA